MQKVFDVNNKEDMDLLWSILPDKYKSITKCSDYLLDGDSFHCMTEDDAVDVYESFGTFFSINWHDKKTITRPVNYEDMIGCVGWFHDADEVNKKHDRLSTLCSIKDEDIYLFKDEYKGSCWKHFTPAKKSELKFYEDK